MNLQHFAQHVTNIVVEMLSYFILIFVKKQMNSFGKKYYNYTYKMLTKFYVSNPKTNIILKFKYCICI